MCMDLHRICVPSLMFEKYEKKARVILTLILTVVVLARGLHSFPSGPELHG